MVRKFKLDPNEMQDLILAVWKRCKRVRFTVTGPSMAPTIMSGDAVEVRPFTQAISIGDIVLFQTQKDHFYVHRLLRIEKGADGVRYIFKGDGLTLSDLAVPAERVLGQVTAVWRQSTSRPYRLSFRIPGMMRAISLFHRVRPWMLILQRKLIHYMD